MDGSGKTTQTQLLLKNLHRRKIRCRYSHSRFGHFVSIPLLVFARLAKLTEVERVGGKNLGYHYFERLGPVARLYPLTFLIDTIISYAVKIYLPLLLGFVVVSDRFVSDALVDLSVSTKFENIEKSMLGRLYLRLVPKRTITFFLKVRYETLKERRADVFQDKTIGKRVSTYDRLIPHLGVHVLDGEASIESIQNEILTHLTLGVS